MTEEEKSKKKKLGTVAAKYAAGAVIGYITYHVITSFGYFNTNDHILLVFSTFNFWVVLQRRVWNAIPALGNRYYSYFKLTFAEFSLRCSLSFRT